MEKLTLRRVSDALMLHYVGEITLEITGDLKRQLDKELDGGDVKTVVVDLSDVSFMSGTVTGIKQESGTYYLDIGNDRYVAFTAITNVDDSSSSSSSSDGS